MNHSSSQPTAFRYDVSLHEVFQLLQQEQFVVITDENLHEHYGGQIAHTKKIVIPAGESCKTQSTVNGIIEKMLQWHCDRSTVVVGLGGGVVCDIAGYVASVYNRGVALVLVPSSLLAMVDAAVGGKNGVNVGTLKNMVGTVYQPKEIIYSFALLDTLPASEWINGFAEIIKHACIKDAAMFQELEQHNPDHYRQHRVALTQLVKKNVSIKSAIAHSDPHEKGDRQLLNFGHTLGHAIENLYQLPHGRAVSIGMRLACRFSEEINMFYSAERQRVEQLLIRYGLSVELKFDKEKIWQAVVMDKKRQNNQINFILLNTIGDARVQPISLVQLKGMIDAL